MLENPYSTDNGPNSTRFQWCAAAFYATEYPTWNILYSILPISKRFNGQWFKRLLLYVWIVWNFQRCMFEEKRSVKMQ